MLQILNNNLLWQDGKFIALTLLFFGIISYILFKPLLIFVFGFFLFSLYFFRNPVRICEPYKEDKSIIICPADGKVVDISIGDFEGFNKKISIFLSPFDVHVNWIPQDGIIKKINYRPGKFVVAYAPKSSDINERNDIIIECSNGKNILVRQIAGFVARRICCWIKEGDNVKGGQKYGMIRFGSRVDILLPSNVEIKVSIGDRTKGGETVLGRWL
jgi:phosphatidylserine decarboxylase